MPLLRHLLSFLARAILTFRRSEPSFDVPFGPDEAPYLELDPRSFSKELAQDMFGFDNASDLAEWNPAELSFVSDFDAYQAALPSGTTPEVISIPGSSHRCLSFSAPSTSSPRTDRPSDPVEYLAILEPLKNLPCLKYADAYYSYEYCHLKKVRQVPIGSKSLYYSLGHFFPKNPKSVGFKFLGKAFVINYFAGDKCAPYFPHVERETEVRFVCNKKKDAPPVEILSIFEISVCKYVITIAASSLCPLQSPELTNLEASVEKRRLVCGNVDTPVEGQHGPAVLDSQKARAIWLSKLASLLSANNPHSLLAKALLDMTNLDSIEQSNSLSDMLDVFAIKSLQHKIEKAVNDASNLESKTGRNSKKRRIFITTFERDEADSGGTAKKSKKKKKTYKIEL